MKWFKSLSLGLLFFTAFCSAGIYAAPKTTSKPLISTHFFKKTPPVKNKLKQKQKVRRIFLSARKTIHELEISLQSNLIHLKEELLKQEVDMQKINTLMATINKAYSQLLDIRMQTVVQIKQLTGEAPLYFLEFKQTLYKRLYQRPMPFHHTMPTN